MMEKGVNQYWTPQAEELYERLLATCRTFAEQDLLMSIRDLLKYDLRTREGKRAVAQARLRIATATDEDIEELAALQVGLENKEKIDNGMTIEELLPLQAGRVGVLKKLRAKVREKGIKRSELKCQ